VQSLQKTLKLLREARNSRSGRGRDWSRDPTWEAVLTRMAQMERLKEDGQVQSHEVQKDLKKTNMQKTTG